MRPEVVCASTSNRTGLGVVRRKLSAPPGCPPFSFVEAFVYGLSPVKSQTRYTWSLWQASATE